MKRFLIALLAGAALLSLLCVGLIFALAFTPLRTQAAAVIHTISQRANLNFVTRERDQHRGLPNAKNNAAQDGILIAGVLPDSPAAQADLRRGDILLAVNGSAVNSLPDLMQRLSSLSSGDKVTLTVQRGDQQVDLTATADSSGPQYGMAHGGMLGIIPSGMGMTGPQNVPQSQSRAGALITEVTSGSPAETAGLQPQEWVTEVDGNPVADASALIAQVQQHKPGDKVTLTVENSAGESRQVSVTLAESPTATQKGQAWLGVRLETNPRSFNDQGQAPNLVPNQPNLPGGSDNPSEMVNPPLPDGYDHGAVVMEVTKGGPADQAGLTVGQIILAVNAEKLTTSDALKASIVALHPGDQVTLTIATPNETETHDVTVTLGENPDQSGAAYLGVRYGFLQPAAPTTPGGPVN